MEYCGNVKPCGFSTLAVDSPECCRHPNHSGEHMGHDVRGGLPVYWPNQSSETAAHDQQLDLNLAAT